MGEDAARAIHSAYDNSKDDVRYQARLAYCGAAWLKKHSPENLPEMVLGVIEGADPRIKIVALRIARQNDVDVLKVVRALAEDADPAVRRECAIALRHSKSPEAPELWATLALQHDGQDRWYLEALGIGADKNWDAYLDAYLAKAGDKLMTPAAKDIVWRSRAKKTPELLAKIIQDGSTKKDDQPRYMRAFDFQPKSAEKDKALQALLGLE
jgi:hypothetical protein